MHGTLGVIAGSACALGLPSSDTATVVYTPAAGYVGADSFAYKVSDGVFDSAPATIAITVRPKSPPTCATGPIAGCAAPSSSGRALLKMRNASSDSRDRLVWQWRPGTAARADFGDPLTDTDYQLCVFDAGGNTVARASAPSGGTCDGVPCWRETPNKLSYKSASTRLTLKPSPTGKAKIIAKVRGVGLGLHSLPAMQPL